MSSANRSRTALRLRASRWTVLVRPGFGPAAPGQSTSSQLARIVPVSLPHRCIGVRSRNSTVSSASQPSASQVTQ